MLDTMNDGCLAVVPVDCTLWINDSLDDPSKANSRLRPV